MSLVAAGIEPHVVAADAPVEVIAREELLDGEHGRQPELRWDHDEALLRVVRVRVHRLGETPVLEELEFEGRAAPPVEVIERLQPRVEDPIVLMHALSAGTRLFAFEMQGIDWERAGFRKLGPIGQRAGDDEASLPSSGSSWAELAARYQRRWGAATSS